MPLPSILGGGCASVRVCVRVCVCRGQEQEQAWQVHVQYGAPHGTPR